MAMTRSCPDCQSKMDEGFIPDASYGTILQSHWHAGSPKKATLLGMPAGTKVNKMQMTAIAAYRCSNCGLLRCYAPPKRRRRFS